MPPIIQLKITKLKMILFVSLLIVNLLIDCFDLKLIFRLKVYAPNYPIENDLIC